MADVTITVNKSGSLLVQGPIRVIDHEGKEFNLEGKDKFWLCRCGNSGNKPFCDGSHRKVGFVSEETAAIHQQREAEKKAKIEAATKQQTQK